MPSGDVLLLLQYQSGNIFIPLKVATYLDISNFYDVYMISASQFYKEGSGMLYQKQITLLYRMNVSNLQSRVQCTLLTTFIPKGAIARF